MLINHGMCKCRNCDKRYDPSKSRADLTGYCSQKCLIAKAKEHGWGKKKTLSRLNVSYYDILKTASEIGDVEWIEPAIVPFGRQPEQKCVWVFTAKGTSIHVVAVTDYDPEVITVAGGASDKHLWELLEKYLQKVIVDGDPPTTDLREYLDQYAASNFQVDKMPVLTGGPLS